MTIRILIADDHPLVREGLKAALATVPEVEIVAEAATGQTAIREAVLHRPHVAVMDLQMPDLNGIDAARELARAVPTTASWSYPCSTTKTRCSRGCAPVGLSGSRTSW